MGQWSRIFIILTLIGICSSAGIVVTTNYKSTYAQTTDLLTSKPMPSKMNTPVNLSSTKSSIIANNVPKIRILSPPNGQKIPVTNRTLIVSGTSSDDRLKDCRVSVLLNGIKPYQNTLATGRYGANDYSTWRYKLDPNYTIIRNGTNKLTAKITCLDNPYSSNKWTSIDLNGTKEDNSRNTTSVVKPMPLGISIRIGKNSITAGDVQTITMRVFHTGTPNLAASRAKVSGQIIDLSSFPFSSHPSSKEINAIVEQFDGNTDRNGEVSYSWKVPENTPIGTPYIINVDAVSGKYSGRSESNIFTVELSNNDNTFILAQASRNFTNGLNDNIKNFTQEIFDEVRRSMKDKL